MMREEYHGYGVYLHGQYLAVSDRPNTPALFVKRADAVKFRNELMGHGIVKGRVVKVKVVYEWEG